jgi:hypothetical protein
MFPYLSSESSFTFLPKVPLPFFRKFLYLSPESSLTFLPKVPLLSSESSFTFLPKVPLPFFRKFPYLSSESIREEASQKGSQTKTRKEEHFPQYWQVSALEKGIGSQEKKNCQKGPL